MNNLMNLISFEYRKIFVRKSFYISAILALSVIILSCAASVLGNYGENNESNYKAMQKDRSYARALSGRELDADLILEAAGAYAAIPNSLKRYTDTQEYQVYARPYSSIYGLMGIYNSPSHKFELSDMQHMTRKQALSYYDVREIKLRQILESLTMNEVSKKKLLLKDKEVQKPFILESVAGFEKYQAIMYTTGLITAFIIAVCLAPIFAGEYTSGADQLILPSKNGRRSLITAKILVGLSSSFFLCIIFSLTAYLVCMIIYGFDGFAAQHQLSLPLSPYPLTMVKLSFHLIGCVLFGNLLISAVTMLVSAYQKSPFGVIVTVSIFIIAPMFIHIPEAYDPWFSLSICCLQI
jgi:ABC-type transport system involved in multi-copper enzyme maturation permease subunit